MIYRMRRLPDIDLLLSGTDAPGYLFWFRDLRPRPRKRQWAIIELPVSVVLQRMAYLFGSVRLPVALLICSGLRRSVSASPLPECADERINRQSDERSNDKSRGEPGAVAEQRASGESMRALC